LYAIVDVSYLLFLIIYRGRGITLPRSLLITAITFTENGIYKYKVDDDPEDVWLTWRDMRMATWRFDKTFLIFRGVTERTLRD